MRCFYSIFWRDKGEYYGIFEKDPLQKASFLLFFLFLTRLYFNSHANDRTK